MLRRALRSVILSQLTAAAAVALLAGCNGVEVAEPPRVPQQLRPELASIEAPYDPRNDYWTEHLGDYLMPSELRTYWTTPEDQRFREFGRRWLEFALREDLLAQDRTSLSPEELEAFRSAPNCDASQRTLEQILARTSRERDE